MNEKSSDNKWVLFKNFLHNELGISKGDIREWIGEAVKDEARRMIDNTYTSFSPEAVAKKILLEHSLFHGDRFKSEVINKVAEIMAQQLVIIPAENKKPLTLDISKLPCGCTQMHVDDISKPSIFTCLCGKTKKRFIEYKTGR